MACISAPRDLENMPSIVILGGGAAGAKLAAKLKKKANVTLVDPKNYFEIRYGVLRMAVEPHKAHKLLAKYETFLQGVKLIQGQAARVDPGAGGKGGTVMLASGQSVAFDYLVIAVGGIYQDAFIAGLAQDFNQRVGEFKQFNDRIKAANSVTIVGGGTVGVELAGEIATEYKDKAVTIVHPKPYLLHQASEAAGKAAMQFLQDKGVKVLLGQKANFQPDGRALTTTNGENIAADLTVQAMGFRPNTAFLQQGPMAAALDDGQKVKVNERLQVMAGNQVLQNIYAIGDVNNFDCWKTGGNAAHQADWTAGALLKQMKNQSVPAFKARPNMMIVSVGRDKGIMSLPSGSIKTGFLPTTVKSAREGAVPTGANNMRGMYGIPKA